MSYSFLVAFLLSIPTHQQAGPVDSPSILNPRTAETVEAAAAAETLAGRDVVFLGEEHDSLPGHQMQLTLVTEMHKLRPDLVISMEMFERDVQGVLNDYLRGTIDEETFRKHSRPWPNYEEHYRPIVEFAKENGLDVIAGNVPRRIASSLASGNPAAGSDAVYVPRTTSAPEDAYWANFQGAMHGHGGAGADDSMRRFYEAQCLKDDAMAEAITDYLATHPHREPLVVHLCGKFHSDGGLGTVSRLVDRAPLLQTGIVSMQTVSADEEADANELRDVAHFVVIIKKPKDESSEADSADGNPSSRL